MVPKQLSKKELNKIRSSRKVRRQLARISHFWFFSIYLAEYISYPFAPFHYEIFQITEDEDTGFAIIVAFRDSGKSTLITLSLSIWAIIGVLNKKFVLILSQTQAQARNHLANIRKELETNDLLKRDIGPFREETDEWGATTLVLSNYNARIMIASSEQSVRGVKHGAHRPDLVICDDVEDLTSVKTKEGRDKTWDWFTGEILPIGSKNTKFVVVGNLLHEDSLIKRLKRAIDEKSLSARYFEYPLTDDDGNVAWPGKFTTQKDVEKLRATVASDVAWYREYLLKIISDTERVVLKEWIQTYSKLPKESETATHLYTISAVDPAISKSNYASYTAIVSAQVWRIGGEIVIFILPNPVNKRLSFPETKEIIKARSEALGDGYRTKILIEAISYIQVLAQELEQAGYPVEAVKGLKGDKRERLALTSPWIKEAKVLFPEKGAEQLIEQITGFGIENHDDLADAFSLLVLWVIKDISENQNGPSTIIFNSIFDRSKLGDFESFDFDKEF